MRHFNTYTQLQCKCNPSLAPTLQDQEFVDWLDTVAYKNLLDLSEKHEQDKSDYYSFKKYSQGNAPWDIITYTNTTRIIDLTQIINWVDHMADQLVTDGYFYLALNKWTMTVSVPDVDFVKFDYDHAIKEYVLKHIKKYKLVDYRYIKNDRGGLGNFVHGNNRCWLQKT